MAKVAARDLQKEAAWRQRLRRQAESGQSVRAWCRTHRVTETGFYWWRRELARRDAERRPAARRDAERRPAAQCEARRKLAARREARRKPAARCEAENETAAFVPVQVSEEVAEDRDPRSGSPRGDRGRIEIVLSDVRRVRVTGAVNQPLLRMVLETLVTADAGAAEQRAC